MTRENTIEKAIELLKPNALKYEKTLSELWWVTQDDYGVDDGGNYCVDCIKHAVNKERRDYLLHQRSLPIDKRDKEFSKFRKVRSDDFESEYPLHCNNCNSHLYTVRLPCDEEINYIIDCIKDDRINNEIGYEAYLILHNDWDTLKKYPEEYHLTLDLAELVINKLEK